MRPSVPALAALALLAPAALAAQRIEATVHAQAATYRVRSGGPVEEGSTAYPGGGGALWLGNVRVGVEGVFGAVNSRAPDGFKVRTTTLTAGVRALPFEFGIEAVARRRTSNAGTTTTMQRLAGPYAAALADFGGGFGGLARLSYYPVRRTLNTDPLSLALRAEVGARFTPRNSSISFFTSYRLLRLDYEAVAGGEPRLEQDAGMFVGVTWISGQPR